MTLLRGRRGALLLLLPLAIFIIVTTLLRPREPIGHADDYPARAAQAARVRAMVDQLRAAGAPREIVEAPPKIPDEPKPCKCLPPEHRITNGMPVR